LTLDPFALSALNTLTTLTASLIVGLAALDGTAPIDTLWQAANLEELWQADLWGHDPEATARRDRRSAEFAMAARFAGLVRNA
jgi:chaperone required for assembly of F1-ATPase